MTTIPTRDTLEGLSLEDRSFVLALAIVEHSVSGNGGY